MKIVINTRIGGFALSDEAARWMRARGNPYALAQRLYGESYGDGSVCAVKDANSLGLIPRNNEDLLAVVETLRERAFGDCTELKVVGIPDDVAWEIQESES